ncbi:hypothetical protein [uncultured Sphingomonas sp.]|uniref:hypothetical protein n=1 Tax=uncultured Sphingomonas sp. TaxID=158754 RepID=UPI0025F6B6F1|nr:hypothetical protein [uncultured Sphingomonas sp.]
MISSRAPAPAGAPAGACNAAWRPLVRAQLLLLQPPAVVPVEKRRMRKRIAVVTSPCCAMRDGAAG